MDFEDYIEETLYMLAQEPEAVTRKSEYMGIVYEDENGKLGRMPFFKLGATGGQAGVSIPKGAKLRAIVHNHPDMDERAALAAFSAMDVEAAHQLSTPMYVLSQGGSGYGETVKYVPGQTRRAKGDKPTKGDKVLAEFPIAAQRLTIAQRIRNSGLPESIKNRLLNQPEIVATSGTHNTLVR